MSTTIQGTPMVEEVVEGCLRRAFRSALEAAGLGATQISCYWLGEETGKDEPKKAQPPFVFIQASPSTMPGYRSSIRGMQVGVVMATYQDDDSFQQDSPQNAEGVQGIPALRNLYKAIRYAIDHESFAPFDDPVASYGYTIDDGQIDTSDPRIPSVSLSLNFRLSVKPSA